MAEVLECVSPSVTTSLLVGASSLLIFYGVWRKQHKQCNYPPGPFSFPLLGNLIQIARENSMDEFFNKCREKFGDIFTIEFGGDKRVVVCGYQNIHDLLVKNADVTSSRPTDIFPPEMKKIVDETPGMLWAPYPHWKTQRSFVLHFMREEGMGKQTLETKVEEEITLFSQHYIDSQLGKPVDLTKGLCKATSNVLSEMIFGGRNEYDDPGFDSFLENIDKSMKTFMLAGITKNIPFARYFKASGLQEAFSAFDYILPFVTKRFMQHKEDINLEEPRDIFDMYLLHQKKPGADKTAFSGNERAPSYKDRINMPFTDAFLLETLRLANIAPNALPHGMEKSLEISGKVIPAGAELMLYLGSVHYDEEVFEQPFVFKPERYLSGDVALKKRRTIPFSLGRRNCLGESLAKMEFFMFYVTLMQKYEFELASDSLKTSTKPVAGLTNTPQPYNLIFRNRL